jgi:hypothetical protein
MAVFQEYTPLPDLDSVSWKQMRVPPSGRSGVRWETTYNVVLGDYRQEGGVGYYTASQILPAAMGTQWTIMFADGTQRLIPDGEAPEPDEIVIRNMSGSSANPGVGMDGSAAAYRRDRLSNSNSLFKAAPAPTYHAALFQNLVLGEVIGSNVLVGPWELTFTGNADKATVIAEEIEGTIIVTVNYSTTSALIKERIQAPRREEAA